MSSETSSDDDTSVSVHVRVSSGSRVDVVRVYREGRLVASIDVCADSKELPLDIPLLPGLNRLTAIAFDDAGYASNPLVIDVKRTRDGARPDLWIVSIGVGQYPRMGAEQQLHAADDAKELSVALARAAARGGLYAHVHAPPPLLDEKVTTKSVVDALEELSTMNADDTAIVFLSGHGVKPGRDQDMVFLMGDAGPDPADALAHGIAWKDLAGPLSRAKGRVIVLLDACHAGHVTQELLVENNAMAAALIEGGRTGTIVFAASKGRQPSFETGAIKGLDAVKVQSHAAGSPGPNGVFSRALVDSLAETTDRNGDGAIQLSEWIDDVTARVVRATDGQQTPRVTRRELFGDFKLWSAAP
jgi:uncharacterized caspase-like protein